MVQTRSRLEGPQASNTVPPDRQEGNIRVAAATTMGGNSNCSPREQYDTNYTAENGGEADSQNELVKLKLKNQALIQLLQGV